MTLHTSTNPLPPHHPHHLNFLSFTPAPPPQFPYPPTLSCIDFLRSPTLYPRTPPQHSPAHPVSTIFVDSVNKSLFASPASLYLFPRLTTYASVAPNVPLTVSLLCSCVTSHSTLIYILYYPPSV
uniref:Uncharacterized protein n=1 Tax=Knipowitschia caucasica TaxID=637954 RepID=A0AAV2K3A5_KNICA